MEKQQYRVKGIVSEQDICNVIAAISPLGDIRFRVEMTLKDQKKSKRYRSGRLKKLPPSFGKHRFIHCSCSDYEKMLHIHTVVKPYLVKDFSEV